MNWTSSQVQAQQILSTYRESVGISYNQKLSLSESFQLRCKICEADTVLKDGFGSHEMLKCQFLQGLLE